MENQKRVLDRLDTTLKFRNNANMQQMRSYTVLNEVGRTSGDTIGSRASDVLFPVCKASELKDSSGNHIGCYVGFVPLSNFESTVVHKGESFEAANGCSVVLDKNGYILETRI